MLSLGESENVAWSGWSEVEVSLVASVCVLASSFVGKSVCVRWFRLVLCALRESLLRRIVNVLAIRCRTTRSISAQGFILSNSTMASLVELRWPLSEGEPNKWRQRGGYNRWSSVVRVLGTSKRFRAWYRQLRLDWRFRARYRARSRQVRLVWRGHLSLGQKATKAWWLYSDGAAAKRGRDSTRFVVLLRLADTLVLGSKVRQVLSQLADSSTWGYER